MAKILITAIQVNFVLIPSGMRQHKSTRIVFWHQPIPSQPFLGCPFDFTTFFTLVILNKAAPFYSQAVFE